MDLELRHANYRDWRQLAVLMPAIFPELTKDSVAYYLCHTSLNMGVARSGKQVIGFYQFNPAKSAQTAWLNYIGVSKHRSQKSIGSKLLRYFEEHAHSVGFTKIELYVRQENIIAQKFYEKNGYRFVEIRRGATDTNLLYTKEITATSTPAQAQAATSTVDSSFFRRIKCKFLYGLYVIIPNTLSFPAHKQK